MRQRHYRKVDDSLLQESEVGMQRVDEAAGLARPAGFGTTYREQQFDASADEQDDAWSAEGEVASRAPGRRADKSDDAASAAAYVVGENQETVSEAKKDNLHAARTLMPFVRRSSHDHIRYVLGWLLLGLGDTAGVWGAAIWLGEVPYVALGQALATGFAAVTAGLAGGELQDLRQSRLRHREAELLSSDERRYQRLFAGADVGLSITKIVMGISVTIVVLVAVAVFALRAGTEGLLAGFTFGGLAAATALGSFVSSYVHADEVADLLATYEKRYRRAQRRHLRLASARVLSRHASAVGEVNSILREYKARGSAAHQKVVALKYRMLARNPQVVGHGEAVPETVIGRRSRLDGAA